MAAGKKEREGEWVAVFFVDRCAVLHLIAVIILIILCARYYKLIIFINKSYETYFLDLSESFLVACQTNSKQRPNLSLSATFTLFPVVATQTVNMQYTG